EVQAARMAAGRRTADDVAALDAALDARTEVAPAGGARFVDADIALHAAVVAAAHNPVLTDLFAEFVPALREGLVDLLGLIDVTAHDAGHGAAAHAGLVEAVKAGDAERAARVLQAELDRTLAQLRAR
ncbi:FCD domain-containing protein, partial [Actinacidiphila acidipaludis]